MSRIFASLTGCLSLELNLAESTHDFVLEPNYKKSNALSEAYINCVKIMQCHAMRNYTGCKKAVEDGVRNINSRCENVWCVGAKHQSLYSDIWCKLVQGWHGSIWMPDQPSLKRHDLQEPPKPTKAVTEKKPEGKINTERERDNTLKPTHSTHGDSERCGSSGRSLHGGCGLVRGAAWHASTAACPLWRWLWRWKHIFKMWN